VLNALPLYSSEFSRLVTCLRQLTVGFSRWGPGFSPKAFHTKIVVNKLALGQVFVPVRRYFPASYHCTNAPHSLNLSSQGWATSLVDVPFTQKLFLQRYSLCRGGNDNEWLRVKKNSRSEFLQIPHFCGTTKVIARILLHHTLSWTYWSCFASQILKFCWPCISVYLSHYLTNLMHKICFTISFISCLYMFRAHVLETCRGMK